MPTSSTISEPPRDTPRDTVAPKANPEKPEERKTLETIPPEAKPEVVKPDTQKPPTNGKQKPSGGGLN